ncbi:MAG: hypothetical protein PHR82_00015 [Endomicrobiaceae bacterium]|nr:hypothetical protein [Endomicrobiaceae bacterium]
MLSILTGLPENKAKDKNTCIDFSKSAGKKAICGTTTMKVYCAQLNLKPEIIFTNTETLPVPKYKIEGIFLATEGVITLNDCYKKLKGEPVENQDAITLAELLKQENEIIFITGTSRNQDVIFYKKNNLLPRDEIINKIIDILPSDKKITIKKV